MSHPVWPSNLTDFTAIGATPDLSASFPHVARTSYSRAWVAGNIPDASTGMFSHAENMLGVPSGGRRRDSERSWSDLGESYVAPERGDIAGVGFPVAVGTPITSSQDTIQSQKQTSSSGLMDSHHPSQSSFTARSPSAMSDENVAYSATSSSSNHSGSQYPSPGPQVYTPLSQSHNYMAEPLIPSHFPQASVYTDYFSNAATESLCLFNDIEAQFYPTPTSPASSSSPGPNFITANSTTVIPNYSGPIRNHIVNMSTDSNGVVWIVFPYSKNKEVKNHTIRCDVDKVPPSALRADIKTVSAAAYPMVGAIILGERNFRDYTGKRFAYEWDCCWLGWSLAQLNPTLLEQKGLLQRATDNVASFVFEGCMSRTKLKSHRTEKNKTRDSQLPLHDWETYMIPRPEWLPGLDQDKREKERLKVLFKQTEEEYEKCVKGSKDPKVTEVASSKAIRFYAERVNGEFVTPQQNSNATGTSGAEKRNHEAMGKRMETSSVMNYINIPGDPHLETKDSQQIRVNVLTDRVRENVISDSVRVEGMVFIDVFDTTGMADMTLKKEIDKRKAIVEYYRHNDIGLVKRMDDGGLPSLGELIQKCGLSIEEYEQHWKDFKLEMNGLGFKIKYLDTNNRHQKITDPLLMQRVLFEILRRSCDTTAERQSKKRKADILLTRGDGKYAEEGFRRESRGARPGMMDWQVKRRCTEGLEQAAVKRMYTAVCD